MHTHSIYMTLIGVHETMCLMHPKCHVTDLLVVDLLGWKGSRTVCVACDEIAHSREFVYAYYFTPMAHHFTLPPHAGLDTHVPCVLHSVYHLLCAVLVLGSATCNTKNLMLVTPVSAHIVHAIVACTRMGIMHNFHVVWRANIADFPQIFVNSTRNMQTFPPGSVYYWPTL